MNDRRSTESLTLQHGILLRRQIEEYSISARRDGVISNQSALRSSMPLRETRSMITPDELNSNAKKPTATRRRISYPSAELPSYGCYGFWPESEQLEGIMVKHVKKVKSLNCLFLYL